MTPSDGSGQPRRFFLILQSGKDHRGRIGEGAVGIKGVPGLGLTEGRAREVGAERAFPVGQVTRDGIT